MGWGMATGHLWAAAIMGGSFPEAVPCLPGHFHGGLWRFPNLKPSAHSSTSLSP